MSTSEDPSSYLDRAKGRDLTEIFVTGFGAWILSIWGSMIAGFQEVFAFLFLPFELLIEIASNSVDSFILTPMGITDAGAAITAQEIEVFGFFALPVSVALVLGTFLVIVMYLQFSTTSNFLPGLFVDNRILGFFFTTSEEEAEGED